MGKSDSKSAGELRVPKHGRGAIRAGSKPGNTPGTGRPPSELRARMRGALVDRIAIAEEIADDDKASPSDRLRALDFLAKYGMGTTVTETDATGATAEKVIRVIREDRPLRRDGD